jgi:hypothetical protein
VPLCDIISPSVDKDKSMTDKSRQKRRKGPPPYIRVTGNKRSMAGLLARSAARTSAIADCAS